MNEAQKRLKTRENENQKLKSDLQEKQIELNDFEGRFNHQVTEKRRLESENQKFQNDLQQKIQAIKERYNTYIKRELLC